MLLVASLPEPMARSGPKTAKRDSSMALCGLQIISGWAQKEEKRFEKTRKLNEVACSFICLWLVC